MGRSRRLKGQRCGNDGEEDREDSDAKNQSGSKAGKETSRKEIGSAKKDENFLRQKEVFGEVAENDVESGPFAGE
jgi:hypothetical protein